jgi:hypothetical protein
LSCFITVFVVYAAERPVAGGTELPAPRLVAAGMHR